MLGHRDLVREGSLGRDICPSFRIRLPGTLVGFYEG
jgi:hypothetical protein